MFMCVYTQVSVYTHTFAKGRRIRERKQIVKDTDLC